MTTWKDSGTTLNVRWFGAVGDRATDDSAAINDAIKALGPNGGTIEFSPGTYAVSSTINLIDDDPNGNCHGIRLRGKRAMQAGAGATTILWTGSNTPCILKLWSRENMIEALTFSRSGSGIV